MPYDLRQWPDTVYPGEAQQLPMAVVAIDVALRALRMNGPRLDEYGFKPLGKELDGLWQINFKVNRQQIRILYAPYGMAIVIFRIHKKSSDQEQQRAYKLAGKRKREADKIIKSKGISNVGHVTIH